MAEGPGSSPSPPRLRVAFVTFSFGELSFRLTSGLADHADVLLVTCEEQAAPHLRLQDGRVRLWAPPLPRLRHVWAQFRFQLAAVRAIKAFKPDVIHLQGGHLWFNAVLPLLRRYPLVVTIHDPRYHPGDKPSQKTPQWVNDFGFRRADLVIVHVPQMIEPVVEEIGVRAQDVRVIPHVEIGDQDLAVDVPEDGDGILWFGRIWPYKGLDYLIRAQPAVTSRVPGARFVIAGQGEDFDRYRQAMVDPDRFTVYNEYVSSELQAELFRRSSVVVLPYLEATQSGVVVNAYAYSKPVVATAVGGLCEQVDHGRTGLLVPPADEDALAEALIQLLEDDQLRTTMGQAANRKLREEWSVPVVAGQTVATYREAINRRVTS